MSPNADICNTKFPCKEAPTVRWILPTVLLRVYNPRESVCFPRLAVHSYKPSCMAWLTLIIRLHKSRSALNNYGICLNYHHCLSNEVTQNLNNFKTMTSATNLNIRKDQNGNEKRNSSNSNNGNGISNGVISDAAHGLYQGILYHQSVVRFHATHLNVIPFTRRRSWLRHCATSRKVAGSIPDGITGIFLLHNPSDCTTALRLIQPLTEMSTRNISWG
jgi:hypothetical protein